jgi:hypothetical protein
MSKNNIEYKQRITAFVDILGFKNIVESTISNKIIDSSKVQDIGEVLLYAIDELKEFTGGGIENNTFRFSHFSDSFVVSRVIETRYDIMLFFIALSNIMDALRTSRMLVRGGVTIGELMHDHGLLFGPALNRAYKLESKHAIVPRIIVDENLEKEFPEIDDVGGRTDLPEFNYCSFRDHVLDEMFFSVDDDGATYVDQFKAIMSKAFFVIPGHMSALRGIINQIPESTESLLKKKIWLINKYNKAISNFCTDSFQSRLEDKMEDHSYITELDAQEMIRDAFEMKKELLLPQSVLQ